MRDLKTAKTNLKKLKKTWIPTEDLTPSGGLIQLLNLESYNQALFERGQRGFSLEDSWNFDTYLLKLIVNILAFQRQRVTNFAIANIIDPNTGKILEGKDLVKANKKRLKSLEKRFRKILKNQDHEDTREKIKEAMSDLGEVLPDLWW